MPEPAPQPASPGSLARPAPVRRVWERELGRVAASLLWLGVAIELVVVASQVVSGRPQVREPLSVTFLVVTVVAYGATGALLAVRRPRNAIGWLLWTMSWLLTATTIELGPSIIVGSLDVAVDLLFIIGIVFIPLLFPNGRPPSSRWIPIVWYAVIAASFSVVGPRVVPIVWQSTLGALDTLLLYPAAAFALLAPIVRYRRGTSTERQQLRWLASAAIMAAAGLIVASLFPVWSTPLDELIGGMGWFTALVGIALIPVTIAIAITRYRLYEIDRIISRTIGYALVTGVLVAVFGGAVLGLQALLEPVTEGNTLAVAASTLIVAALFQPLRRRVQSAVDRRFNRAHYDAQRIADAFAGRLRDEVDITAVTSDLHATVHRALDPSGLGLWLREPTGAER